MQHLTPHFDLRGQQVGSKPLPPQPLRLPPGWGEGPSNRTQAQMREERRLERIPDLTYDLDQDGKVGGQDMVVAHLFDFDKNGRLETEERKAAETALSAVRCIQGIASKFIWGLDSAPRQLTQRLRQVRGVIIDGDDSSALQSTYPKFPVQETGRPSTFSELQKRRNEDKFRSLQDIKQRNKASPFVQPSPPVPLSTSTHSEQSRPSTEIKSKTQLTAARRQAMLQELEATKNYHHVSREQHMTDRESHFICIVPPGQEGLTQRRIAEERRQAVNEYNMNTFSNKTIGIHGKELPHFEEHRPAYWELRSDYNPHPTHVSRLQLQQTQKFWAPTDTYTLADKDAHMPPPDAFKTVHVSQQRKKDQVGRKPTQCAPAGFNPLEQKELPDTVAPHKQRWTTLVHNFKKGSVFALPKDPDLQEETEDLVEEPSADLQSAAPASSVSRLQPSRLNAASERRLLRTSSQSLVRTLGFLT